MKKLLTTLSVLLLALVLVSCKKDGSKLTLTLNKGIDTIEVYKDWVDAGIKAVDKDNKSYEWEVIENNIDTNKLGSYKVVYQAKNDTDKKFKITRKVSVVDNTKPVIKLNKGVDTINLGDVWTDAGATATDNYDGDITNSITVSGTVDTTKKGTYTITYQVEDTSGNKTSIKRIVTVI